MGLGGISIWQLLIVLVIVVAIFGTKKFRNIGSDLGSAIKGFKQGIKDDENDASGAEKPPEAISQAKKEAADTSTDAQAANTAEEAKK